MPLNSIDEKTILKELQQVPEDRWSEVLMFIRTLQPGKEPSATEHPIRAGTDLADSDLIGIWADRTDIRDTLQFARSLRHRAEDRRGTTDAGGH